jgi:hypothetical protein
MNAHYFIITRFNVNIYNIDFPKRLENTWLTHRFELFQKFCFPSVASQLDQDFSWLVLFDEKTPHIYKRLINTYTQYKNFIPLFCESYEETMPNVSKKMKEIAPNVDLFISTRLDNDDALSVRYIQTLRKIVCSYKKNESLYINFFNGLQYKDGIFYDFKDKTNAFVSLVEKNPSPKTVFWVDHPAIYSVASVMQIDAPPLWLQVLHDFNVYNYIRGPVTKVSDIKKIFACNF